MVNYNKISGEDHRAPIGRMIELFMVCLGVRLQDLNECDKAGSRQSLGAAHEISPVEDTFLPSLLLAFVPF